MKKSFYQLLREEKDKDYTFILQPAGTGKLDFLRYKRTTIHARCLLLNDQIIKLQAQLKKEATKETEIEREIMLLAQRRKEI